MKTKRNYLWLYPLINVFLILCICGYQKENLFTATIIPYATINGNNIVGDINKADEIGIPINFISGDCGTIMEKPEANNIDRIAVKLDSPQRTVTDVDGNVYQTVLIGEREWMAENLKTTKYNDSTPITTGLSDLDWRNNTSGAYTIYPHDDVRGINSESDMLAAYGALYNWYASENDNLCPDGWHIPSDEEWTELTDYIASVNSINIGNQLKSCRQDGSPLGGKCADSQHPRWNSHKLHHGIDKFGFAALPGGIRHNNGTFSLIGSHANWWSATEGTAAYAWSMRSGFDSGDVFRFLNNKACGLSVRCVRRGVE